MIALIGSEGSMGKRYQAVFQHLNLRYLPLDKDKTPKTIIEEAKKCERILIASPTHTHVDFLRELLPTRKPILCEKPVTKDFESLLDLHAWCARHGYSYNMVMQYEYLKPSEAINRWSYYNYFRHGNDGLAWDCLQIIALANGPVELKETSPVWSCSINGEMVHIEHMDIAYVLMIQAWVDGKLTQSLDQILEAHNKVRKHIERHSHEPAD